jgi:hypothetical protein
MARRATQAVFSGECGEGMRGLTASEHDGRENQSDSRNGSRKVKDVAQTQTTQSGHSRTPRQDRIKIWYVKTISHKENGHKN